MANPLGAVLEFIPTPEQRRIVSQMKCFGIKEEIIRLVIINPETNEAVSNDTFNKAFEVELKNAKSDGVKSAISVFHSGMQAVKSDGSPDHEIRMKAANKFYQLGTKGILEPKIELRKDMSNGEKLDNIAQGVNEGKLATYESDTMIKAIEVKAKVELEEVHKQLDLIKTKLKEKGIEI